MFVRHVVLVEVPMLLEDLRDLIPLGFREVLIGMDAWRPTLSEGTLEGSLADLVDPSIRPTLCGRNRVLIRLGVMVCSDLDEHVLILRVRILRLDLLPQLVVAVDAVSTPEPLACARVDNAKLRTASGEITAHNLRLRSEAYLLLRPSYKASPRSWCRFG